MTSHHRIALAAMPDESVEFAGFPFDPSDGRRNLRNVTVPALIPYLPSRSIANGTGIVLAPGGGLHFLSVDNEGSWVAQRLVQRGIACFVLHYRVVATPVEPDGFNRVIERAFTDPEFIRDVRRSHQPIALADGTAGLAYVREHAAEWALDQERIGMVGFSAGGFVTATTLMHAPAQARPSFAGLIYPGLVDEVSVPVPVPPVFLAWASDDQLSDQIIGTSLRIYEGWHQAGGSVEAHAYATGGHGFGIAPRGTDSDRWYDEFCHWMDARGY